MYQVGDQVVYGIHGVCRVVDLEERVIDRKRLTYLALEPMGQGGSRYYVPTHNEVAMGKLRQVLTADALEVMLASDDIRADGWVPEENLRKQTYRDLISSGDRCAIMKMVHTLYIHRKTQAEAGKKFHQCDENFLRDAEKLLSSEISLVMDIELEDAKKYLRDRLKCE